MNVVDVQATVDVLHAAVDERPTEDVLIVENRPRRIVSADCELTHLSEGTHWKTVRQAHYQLNYRRFRVMT